MTSQAHGKIFENTIIALHNGNAGSHTAKDDFTKDGRRFSVKTTGSNTVCCGDLMRFYRGCWSEEGFTMIIGIYGQIQDKKKINKIVEIHFSKENVKALFGGENIEDELCDFDKYIKSIPDGKPGQVDTKKQRNDKKEELQKHTGFLKINPKVDSKNQRRVQCSFSLLDITEYTEYTEYTEEYKGKELASYVITSPRRR